MSKDNKIPQIPPQTDTGKGMSQYNNRHSGHNLSETTQTGTETDNTLKNDFGVDKLDLIFQKGEFEYAEQSLKKWTKKTIESEKTRSVKFFYQGGAELPYIAEIVPDQPLKAGYLHISANPSKPHHEYELNSNPTQIFDFYREVFADLRKHLVEPDLEKAKISRLDLAHNIILNHELLTYNNVFDTLQGKRQFKRTYGDSRYWKNGENEFIVYNKKNEIQEFYRKKLNMPNITRAEVKALKGRSVSKIYGVTYLGDILDREFKEEYNLYVTDKILRTKFGQQLRFDFEELEQSFISCIEKFGRNRAIDNFLRIIGVEALTQTKNGLIYFQEIIRSKYNERTVRRQMSKMNDLLSVLKPIQEKREENFIELNDEIRTKLLVA